MKDNLKFTLVAIGIIVAFFIMGREIVETKAKLRKTQEQIVQEKKEKAWFQDELKTTRKELLKTGKNLRTCQGKLDFVNKKISALRGNNTTLIMAKQGLEHKIAFLQEEKKVIEARFHSLRELKKAIRQIKVEIRNDKIKQREEHVRQQVEIDKWETAFGNQGFLTKGGENHYKSKVNVEVRPANINLDKK